MGATMADLDLLGVVRSIIEGPHIRVLVTIDASFASRLAVYNQELAEELTPVPLPELAKPILSDLAQRFATELGEFHDVEVPPGVVALAQAPRAGRDRLWHPGLLYERLDTACARARLRAVGVVAPDDLGLDRSPEVAPPDSGSLADRLRVRVLGQDGAIDRVSSRLALTRARLDLRPDRPDGVFLFVGPTGVGKTELARGIASELFGDENRLIRLDMSEYAQDWALSRLIGPQPGYVGFTEPDSWLTTRVRAQPDAVVLLDEIEKAHPAIWNAFLQVFDAGRLSDARGNVADFSQTVIAMTSNLGARAFNAPSVGFRRAEPELGDDRVLDAVKQTMVPELVNRIGEIVVFQPHDPLAIERIARKEVASAIDRLAERGYRLTVDDDAVALLARTGYDAAYGARHLQRNIERMLLQPLAGRPQRVLRAAVADDAIAWVEDAAAPEPKPTVARGGA
jgi:hypothetical protein